MAATIVNRRVYQVQWRNIGIFLTVVAFAAWVIGFPTYLASSKSYYDTICVEYLSDNVTIFRTSFGFVLPLAMAIYVQVIIVALFIIAWTMVALLGVTVGQMLCYSTTPYNECNMSHPVTRLWFIFSIAIWVLLGAALAIAAVGGILYGIYLLIPRVPRYLDKMFFFLLKEVPAFFVKPLHVDVEMPNLGEK